VTTAEEMFAAVSKEFSHADVLIMAQRLQISRRISRRRKKLKKKM